MNDAARPDSTALSGCKGFWEKGGWWRALVLVVVYFVLYNGLSLLLTPIASQIDDPQSATGILVFYAVPIFVGCLLLVAFAASVGWLPEVFRRQPIRGRGWMWIAIVVVLLFNVLRMLSTTERRGSRSSRPGCSPGCSSASPKRCSLAGSS